VIQRTTQAYGDPGAWSIPATRHDKMVELVERMLDLHKQVPKVKTPHEQESLKRTIEATDHQIDALVYELYGLEEEEIRIIEGVKK
jgi:hypothetical protein